MGTFYSVTFDAFTTGTTADLFATAAAAIVADTAGHRCRIRSIALGPSIPTPIDTNVGVKLARILDVSAGTAGTPGSSPTPIKHDPGSVVSIVGAAIEYSAEPTAYEAAPLWQCDINHRGSLIKEWGPDEAPLATQDMLIGILICPRNTTAVVLSGTMEIEVY